MREATALGLLLAIALGVLAIFQIDSVVVDIQGVLAAGPLNDITGLFPYFVVLLVVGLVATFFIGAVRKRF